MERYEGLAGMGQSGVLGSGPKGASDPFDEALSQMQANRENRSLTFWHRIAWIFAILSIVWGAIIVIVEERLFNILYFDKLLEVLPKLYLLLLAIVFVSFLGVFIFIHRYWKAIPPSYTKTSPGAAVGLLFIPLWNFYWVFVTFRGGCVDMLYAMKDYVNCGKNSGEKPFFPGIGTCTALSVVSLLALIRLLFPAYFLEADTTLATISRYSMYFLTFYPIIFSLCTLCMKRAAMQMNCWRAGATLEEFRNGRGPGQGSRRTTLDELANS